MKTGDTGFEALRRKGWKQQLMHCYEGSDHCALWKTEWQYRQKLTIYLSQDPRYASKRNESTHPPKTYGDKNGLSGFIHDDLKLKNTECASDIEWVNELKYIHIMDYIHSNKKWSSAALNMNLAS